LAGVTGTHQLSSIIKILVDRVVNNRDPYGRAGCALAFGSIFAHVGGLTAGPLLKTAVNVLISLSHDPHPVVHYWALRALAKVIDAASLSYAPFVSSTLSMAFKIYSSESHEPNGGTFHNANIGGDMPAYEVLCTVIDAVINVLGPDMQETSNTQSLALHLAQELFAEMDEGITVEALKCVQHIIMFAPSLISVPELVAQLESHLHSPRRPLKIASLHALYQLVQKDALIMSRLGGDQLVEQLFQMLDSDPSIEGVRSVITSWLKQTAVHNPSAWIDLCLRIMLNTRPRRMDTGATTGTGQDDEGESLNAAAAITSALPSSRWRTQLFALQCLHTICTLVANSGRREHIDIPFARKQGVPLSPLLVSRVHDLIKIAFTASAAYVTDIRLEGLVVLRDVIEVRLDGFHDKWYLSKILDLSPIP
jgi:HEAT repeat-containing protein 5